MSQPTAPTSTTLTAPGVLELLRQDPAAGILAAAALREQRANAATPGPWRIDGALMVENFDASYGICCGSDSVDQDRANAEHIAAEASPAHALAAVRRWRGVVERYEGHHLAYSNVARVIVADDLTETADEARAYLGVTA